MRALVLSAVIVTTLGCASSEPENVPSPTQAPAASNRPASPSPTGAPAASNAPGQPARTVPTEEQLAALQEAFDKSPSNSAAKIALVGAIVARGDYYMYAEDLAPREKYPKALALYRRAATLDPENATAKTGISTIENIYKSMGRPVPEV
jgi:hypothetical protein